MSFDVYDYEAAEVAYNAFHKSFENDEEHSFGSFDELEQSSKDAWASAASSVKLRYGSIY